MSRKNKKYLIIGASSGVGRSIATELAQLGYDLVITSRDHLDVNSVANDLMCRNQNIQVIPKTLDLVNQEDILNFTQWLLNESSENLIGVYCAAGFSSDLDLGVTNSPQLTNLLIDSNYKGILILINPIILYFEKQNHGLIAVISSITVSAPRGINCIYGSAKAGLEYYFRSLQKHFSKSPVNIQIYSLGYVDTSLSYGQELKLPKISADKAAKKIIRNKNRKVETVRYVPYFWYFITLILRNLPWFIYKRLKF